MKRMGGDEQSDTVDWLNKLTREGLPQHLAFAVIKGRMTECEARKEHVCKERAREIKSMPRTKWPEIDVKWDVSPERFYLAADGMTQDEFERAFPVVEIVGVEIEDLYANLVQTSQRVNDPFWKLYKSKTAGLVAHLEQGGLITPPLVRHTPEGLCFAGGNHRFGWARHRQQGRVPILIVSAEKPAIQARLLSLSSWP